MRWVWPELSSLHRPPLAHVQCTEKYICSFPKQRRGWLASKVQISDTVISWKELVRWKIKEKEFNIVFSKIFSSIWVYFLHSVTCSLPSLYQVERCWNWVYSSSIMNFVMKSSLSLGGQSSDCLNIIPWKFRLFSLE